MSRPSKPVVLCILIAAVATSLVRAAPVTELKVMSFNRCVNPWPSDHRAVLTTFAITPPIPLKKTSSAP